MSVTEFKKRSRKKMFCLGMAVSAVPFAAAAAGLAAGMHSYKEENRILKEQAREAVSVTGYVLAEDVSAGQKITSDMLKPVSVTSKDRTYVLDGGVKKLAGMHAKSDFVKGTVLNEQCVYGQKPYASDMRIKSFDFMEINPMIQKGNYIDIRITYPNGEDYIVVNHKEVLSLNQGQEAETNLQENPKVTLKVTEEEILRLASAYVDMLCYADSEIYAVAYLDEFQEPAAVDYPVNPDVFALLGWNPNILDYMPFEGEEQHRSVLEENLTAFGASKEEIFAAEIQKPELNLP